LVRRPALVQESFGAHNARNATILRPAHTATEDSHMPATTQPLDELIRRLSALMPDSVRHMQDDIEKNLRAGLAGALQRMDLVTREEYEVQAALLARSRERLAELEARVATLEQALSGSGPKQNPPSTPGSE
jgi:ubiquinone biosynthesis accessory factor UbiK